MASADEQTTIEPSDCCIQGFVHGGKPQGDVQILHGLQTYVAGNNSSKAVIVIIPDVFGWELSNGRLLADEYAKRSGFTTYLPDFMSNDSAPAELMKTLLPDEEPTGISKFTLMASILPKAAPWLFRHREAVSWKIIKPWFESLYSENPKRKVFVSGFCWGGYYAVKLTHRDGWMMQDGSFREGGFITAAYTAHPSILTIPKDIAAIAKPISFACPEKDHITPAEVEKIRKTLEKKPNVDSEVVLYEKSKHGFAIRANLEDEAQREAMSKATDQAVNWFKKHAL